MEWTTEHCLRASSDTRLEAAEEPPPCGGERARLTPACGNYDTRPRRPQCEPVRPKRLVTNDALTLAVWRNWR